MHRGGRYSGVDAQMAGRSAHMLLWHSGTALLSILGVIYPMRSTVEMARLVHEHDGDWSHRFQSDLVRIEQYAECGCELVVTEPVTNLPELWEDLEADREALWRRILDLSGYDLNDGGTTRWLCTKNGMQRKIKTFPNNKSPLTRSPQHGEGGQAGAPHA